jgi:hypothetical protein
MEYGANRPDSEGEEAGDEFAERQMSLREATGWGVLLVACDDRTVDRLEA